MRAGQESVWDYPRPPRVEPFPGLVRVEFAGETIAETRRAVRVLETSHPPGFYLPVADFRAGVLVPAAGSSWCEFKGQARYYDLVVAARRAEAAAWAYPDPSPGFEVLADRVSLYPGRTDGCWVDGERVRPQAGGFYGGWITDAVAGPFKGEPGTSGW